MKLDVFGDELDTTVQSLGKATIDSPVKGTTIFVDDTERVIVDTTLEYYNRCRSDSGTPHSFELAGPRRKIFLTPRRQNAVSLRAVGCVPALTMLSGASCSSSIMATR